MVTDAHPIQSDIVPRRITRGTFGRDCVESRLESFNSRELTLINQQTEAVLVS